MNERAMNQALSSRATRWMNAASNVVRPFVVFSGFMRPRKAAALWALTALGWLVAG